ncbi:MAG: DNA primase regulatory subunit PriL, partial [Thermoproteota archaeon]
MDISRYPFSKEAAELVQEEGYNIEDLAYHPDLAKARER